MFVGRKNELKLLDDLYRRGEFQMVVVYGRRRVGKTSLINEFAAGKRTLSFTALDQADGDNLKDFSRAIAEFFDLPSSLGGFPSWAAAFDYLADRANAERFVLAFDEFPYAARRNASLPSALQIAIDHKLAKTGLFLVLCGSDQGFMESEVLGRKSPLYGRRTAQIHLRQLTHRDARDMMPSVSAQDTFRYYGCFGGIPYYLAQIHPDEGFRENLRRLYFDPMGFLYEEPYALLRQELSEPALYSSVLRAIANGANRQKEIADRTGIAATSLPRYLRILERLDIIEKAVPFGDNPDSSKRGIYRILDACYDFWFRFVRPNTSDIESGMGAAVARQVSDQQIDEYLGHRFELLCIEWLKEQALEGTLPIPATSVGTWWGTNPSKRAQDDIDVLAADRSGKRLLIGECKYRESFDETAELEDLDAKRDLVRGYHATNVYLFSKHVLSKATREKAASRPDVSLVTLEDMYR